MTQVLIEMSYDHTAGRPAWPADTEIEGHGAVGQWPPPGDTCVVLVRASDEVIEACLAAGGKLLETVRADEPKVGPAPKVLNMSEVTPGRFAVPEVPARVPVSTAEMRNSLARCGVSDQQYRTNGGVLSN